MNYESSCNNNWYVENGILKITIAQFPCAENIIPNSTYWQALEEYTLEFDITLKSGVDRHVYYRVEPSTHFNRVLHFTPDGYSIFQEPGLNVGSYRGYLTGIRYHYKVVVLQNNIKIYESSEINPIPVLTSDYNYSVPMPPGMVGLGSSPGSASSTETWFDNFKISTVDQGLPVPLLKQTDPLWAGDLYDSADTWSTRGQTIGDFGCALTSAVMVFKYSGLDKMPDGSDLTPGSVNEWLNNDQYGYVGEGYVNWLELVKLSKLAAPINGVDFDELDYSRTENKNDALLSSTLTNEIPVILREPGHFVVAKGYDEDNSTYHINDPYYSIKELSDPKYNNDYIRLGTFTPSNSDSSYMMFVGDPNLNIELFDSNNNPVGSSYIEEPIIDQSDDSTSSAKPIKIYYFEKPEGGDYHLNITSSGGAYLLDQYFYDVDSDAKKITVSGEILNGNVDTYNINFDKNDSESSTSELVVPVTFDSVRQKIKDGYHNGKIKFGTQVVLLVELEIAEKARKPKISKGALGLMLFMISKDRRIDKDLAQELVSDINTLINSI